MGRCLHENIRGQLKKTLGVDRSHIPFPYTLWPKWPSTQVLLVSSSRWKGRTSRRQGWREKSPAWAVPHLSYQGHHLEEVTDAPLPHPCLPPQCSSYHSTVLTAVFFSLSPQEPKHKGNWVKGLVSRKSLWSNSSHHCTAVEFHLRRKASSLRCGGWTSQRRILYIGSSRSQFPFVGLR